LIELAKPGLRKFTTRKMSLAEDGSAFLSRRRRFLQDAQDGRDELVERRGELIELLRLSARSASVAACTLPRH
jgi:DNA-binding transcriptional LysR family regulator